MNILRIRSLVLGVLVACSVIVSGVGLDANEAVAVSAQPTITFTLDSNEAEPGDEIGYSISTSGIQMPADYCVVELTQAVCDDVIDLPASGSDTGDLVIPSSHPTGAFKYHALVIDANGQTLSSPNWLAETVQIGSPQAQGPTVSSVEGRPGSTGAFVSGKGYPGGQLKVTGSGFASPASKNFLAFGDDAPFAASSGSSTSLTFIIPAFFSPENGSAKVRIVDGGNITESSSFSLQIVDSDDEGGGPGGNNGNTGGNNGNTGNPPPAGTSNLDCASQGLQPDPKGSGLCLPGNPLGIKDDSLAGSRSVGELIRRVLNILLTLGGVVAVLFIVLGGYEYITSRGNEDQAKKGRKTMTYALVGLIAVLLAFTIVTILTRTVTSGELFS